MSAAELFDQIDQLSTDEKWLLIRHVLDTLQASTAQPVQSDDWQAFLSRTYGSLRDTPIERWPQGDYEHREPLE